MNRFIFISNAIYATCLVLGFFALTRQDWARALLFFGVIFLLDLPVYLRSAFFKRIMSRIKCRYTRR